MGTVGAKPRRPRLRGAHGAGVVAPVTSVVPYSALNSSKRLPSTMRAMMARTSRPWRASTGTQPASSSGENAGSSTAAMGVKPAAAAAAAGAAAGFRLATMRRAMASACATSAAKWSVTPAERQCTSAPPRSSADTTSPVAALTSGGPPRKMVPVPATMTDSSDMAGTYAPPAVHEPMTTATCGMPAADMLAWLKKMRPKWSRSGNTSS